MTARCKDCGGVEARVVANATREHVWLCASCEFRREHPDATPATLPPRERRAKALQKERLFDVE